MPTYERSPEFIELYQRLTAEQKALFRTAVKKFRDGLGRCQGFRKGLSIKGLKGAPGMFELTWAPDGRAVFSFGKSLRQNERHVSWHAVGTHGVLP